MQQVDQLFQHDEIDSGDAPAGLAFGQLPSFLVDSHLAAGRLVAVMRAVEPAPWDIYIYRPQRGPLAQRLRLVFDAVGDALAKV